MKTTESPARAAATTTALARPLVVAAAVTVGLGLVLAALGALTSGGPAAAGALVGAGLVAGVLAFGAFSVNLVAGVMPTASMITALVTYAAQVTTTMVVLLALRERGLIADDTLHPSWLAAGVVVATLTWTVAQIVAFRRARIPIFDLLGPGAR